jgi:hypothetical protein
MFFIFLLGLSLNAFAQNNILPKAEDLFKNFALLRNLIPSLKPGGTVVIVDPDSIKNKGGKSPENRSPEQLRQEAGEAGFEVVRIETFLKIDNIYVLKVRGQAEGELSLHTQKLSDRVLLAGWEILYRRSASLPCRPPGGLSSLKPTSAGRWTPGSGRLLRRSSAGRISSI